VSASRSPRNSNLVADSFKSKEPPSVYVKLLAMPQMFQFR
jgi:hypothetical protein